MSRRLALCSASLLALSCGGKDLVEPPDLKIITEDATDLPITGLPDEMQARFDEGDRLFERSYLATQGLGPLYIRRACAACHEDDAKGPGTVTKMVFVEEDGLTPAEDQSGLPYGHTVRNQRAGASETIEPPPGAKLSKRVGPAVFGRGFIEAIAGAEIERLEAEQANGKDGVTGRINRVTRYSEANPGDPTHALQLGDSNLIGRFGLKARIATLDDFTADAFQGDMGLTSPLRTEELPNPESLADDEKAGIDLDLETVNHVTDYVRLLAIPKRAAPSARGVDLFESTGCATCHVPSLKIDEAHPIHALAGDRAPIYSDLLLHDMGDLLADGVVDESADWREWRTAPLIGIRHLRNYLHDGRAGTIEEAIELHDGPGSEASQAVEHYQLLSAEDRDELVRFVSSL